MKHNSFVLDKKFKNPFISKLLNSTEKPIADNQYESGKGRRSKWENFALFFPFLHGLSKSTKKGAEENSQNGIIVG